MSRAKWNDYVRSLHIAAEEPTSRALADLTGRNHNSINDTIRGHRIASWTVTKSVLLALDPDADLEYAKDLWTAARVEAAGITDTVKELPSVAVRIADALERIALALEEPHAEWQCPNCDAVTRARMADKR